MADISSRPNRYPPLCWEQRIVGTDFSHSQAPRTGALRAAANHADRRVRYGAGDPATVTAGGLFDFGDELGSDGLPSTSGRLADEWKEIKQILVQADAVVDMALVITDADGHETTVESVAAVQNLVFSGPIYLAPDQEIGVTTTGLAGGDICTARVIADIWVRKEGY